MSSLFRYHYLREVLGIERYLPLKRTLEQRVLKRHWPCEILVVSLNPLSLDEKSLLKKIMKSISVSDFSILELGNSSSASQLLEQALTKKLSRYIIIFDDGFSLESKNVLITHSLNKFIGESLEVKERKKKLWQELLKIKKELRL